MKGELFLTAFAVITVFCGAQASAAEPQRLEFEPVGGGKFIYCNNPEAVDSNTLVNSGKPRYIMNNDALGPGTYYLYLSHYNFIGMENNADKVSKDMELDVELTPVSGSCTYTVSRVGFETIKPLAWYDENNIKQTGMAHWGLFNCCAETMQRTLVELNGTVAYEYKGLSEEQTVTASDTRWLSEFTPDYSVVHYREPVHYQAILEIKSGTMNVNVCAFEAGEELGDRSTFRKDAENGIVRYDRTIKGIADTLPQVEADLEYEIDDTDEDGAYLPVISYNQYAPDGITLDEWYTNISPLDDPWAKAAADESGMLAFEYKDKNKLTYYGNNVPESEKSDVWHFDTHHSDTHAYENQPGTNGGDTYSPNYEITAENAASGYATNLGNYGITYTYNLKITNNGHNDRYFTYEPTTGSKIIVYTDEKGKEPGYGLIKPAYYSLEREAMSVVKLPAGETTEFSVNMILPVNYNGGMKNAFIIRDKAEEIDGKRLAEKAPKRNYVKPITGEYLSEYKDKLPADTLVSFDGTLDCYEVVNCGDFYAVRWCEWDGSPQSYSASWWLCDHVYIMDKDFNVTGYHTFENFPNGLSYNNGKVYVRTLTELWESKNGTDWVKSGMKWLPEYVPEPEPEYEPEYTLEEALLKLKGVSEWALEDVKTSVAYGLIPGEQLGINTEKATDFTCGITRDEFCNIAARVIKYLGTVELPENTSIKFNDSNDSYVLRLAALGVVNGYDDGTFRPGNTITREEAAAILARLLELYTMNSTAEMSYSDSADIQDWARDPVSVMSRYGIMNGVDDTRFDPKGTYTVEQSVVTILRAFNAITDNGWLNLPPIPSGGKYYTVYREGYRNNRIELAVYDTEDDSVLVNNDGVLSVSGSYKNDVKYYFSCGRWVQFESGYERISNNASAVLASNKSYEQK